MHKLALRILWGAAILTLVLLTTRGAAQPAEKPAASSQESDGQTIAGTFFMSRVTHADGTQSIDPVGSMLVWALLTLSMVNVGLIGYLVVVNQKKSIVPSGVVKEARRLIAAAQPRQALDLTRKEESFFSQILQAGLQEAPHGFAASIRALEQAADVGITKRMRPIEMLYMFGQVSPMMGLLGTVYGIIFAFRVFVAMGGKASPALLAGGIGTALVATFWGLLVAIPALAAYSFLRNKVDHLTMEAITAAEELLKQCRPKAAQPKPAPAKTVAST